MCKKVIVDTLRGVSTNFAGQHIAKNLAFECVLLLSKLMTKLKNEDILSKY